MSAQGIRVGLQWRAPEEAKVATGGTRRNHQRNFGGDLAGGADKVD